MEERILLAAIEEFQDKGLKFTMDDIAKNLGMSKKTVYTVFDSKETMLLALADYCFSDIKQSEKKIVEDTSLTIVEKIEKILVVLPDRYQNIGLSKLYMLQEKYPSIYRRVEQYLQTDWDATIALLEQGIREGAIRPVSIPVLKLMVESTIAHFFRENLLEENGLSYEEGLSEMLHIIMEGIKTKEQQ